MPREVMQPRTAENGTPQKGEGPITSSKAELIAKGYTGCNACWREGHGHPEK